ncbi:Putative WD40/YVTN repeat-like-containing domain superfamily [Septoria linicola]|uniref:WD40/YVTN repeat-like-containing domain superfamily n=1 Tax=Septoria linicola TaxID=215465 RepID=A0A9Q9ENR7_9PEZI|nr:Putative WD40/YVTN repeat-like-containing domain superfamily [Septoria linicola]
MSALRSSRRSVPRRRYTVDAFEGIEELQSDKSSGDEDSQGEVDEDEDEDDDDTDAFQAGAESPVPSDDDMSAIVELGAVEEVEDDLDSNAGERDLDDNISIASDPELVNPLPRKLVKRKLKEFREPTEMAYMRGVLDNAEIHNRMSKLRRRLHYFGPTTEDTDMLIKARTKWGLEACYPSRKPKKDESGGFGYTSAYQREMASAEENWKWYHEGGGKGAFKKRLAARALSAGEARSYLPHDDNGERHFVMGGIEEQRLYHLKPRQSIYLAGPFEKIPPPGQKWKENLPKDYKTGYVLNLGARIQAMDWASSQLGSKHYLAVSVHPQRSAPQGAPAFSAQPVYNSSIQLWEFTADNTGRIAKATPPRLCKVICTSVGDIKALKWCQIPAKESAVLGFLAFISADGGVRVLAVGKPPPDSSTGYVLVEKFAFEAKPPNTVCSALTWLSSTRLAVACANGCVGIWDVAESLQSPKANPRPILYGSLSTSYIMQLTSGWPSHPQMLMATSMNGFESLTDLSQPFPFTPCGTTLSARSRIGQPVILWNEFIKCALSAEDNHIVRAYPLRRWFGTIGLTKCQSHVSCMAVSPCHPFILTGTVGGDVVGNNPIRRVADGGKGTLWSQTWFSHEWRRPTQEEETAADAPPDNAGNKTAFGMTGLTRFVDGFKVERITLQNSTAGASSNARNGILFTTIYEEKTAITAVAWNPNLHVGGWAAAGMADGLLRVEDIAG